MAGDPYVVTFRGLDSPDGLRHTRSPSVDLLRSPRGMGASAGRAAGQEDASWPLPHALTSARRARRLVTAQLGDWGLHGLADTAELLVSELVTNALRHTHGPVRLNLRVCGLLLRCEVEDASPARPVRRMARPDAEGGRGTELLDLLAEAWGSTRTVTGKITWFELTTLVSRASGLPAAP